MGVSTTGAELKCFNGEKAWSTEWFKADPARPSIKEGHVDIELQPGMIWRGALVGTYDYWKSNQFDPNVGHRVIAKIGDLYMNFNRAEGFTRNLGGFVNGGNNPPNDLAYYVDRVQVTRDTFVIKSGNRREDLSHIPVDGTLGDGEKVYSSCMLHKTILVADTSFYLPPLRAKAIFSLNTF